MAAQVVDELIVTLSLDAQEYDKVEAQVERRTDRTFRKQQERARVTDRTNKDQQRRLKDVAAGVRAFATTVTAAVGIVSGLGVAVGGVLGGFLNFQTALRRQTVGTGLSNKEMQAWSATARRLGADANAGAEALAALAKEQRQGILTGNAPTLQALGKMGVNIDPSRSLQDILGDAQARYRAAPAGQRQQFEDVLAAQGVSSDLILMIKSEIDVREAFNKSMGQAVDENRKTLLQLADALESVRSYAISVAGTLLELLQPAIKEAGKWFGELAKDLANFTTDVREAGGGLDGFTAALDKHVPELMTVLRDMADAISVVVNRFRDTGTALKNLWSWITWLLNKSRAPWGNLPLADDIGMRVSNATGGKGILGAASAWWRQTVADNRARNIAEGRAGWPRTIEATAAQPPAGKAIGTDAQSLMNTLITQYGLTAAQAAAVTANWKAESGLRPSAHNLEGGGQGAQGLAQWRGPRIEAFKRMYGIAPKDATVAEQINFAMTDPYEVQKMRQSFAVGGSAADLGRSYSEIYEAHGKVPEDLRRAREASRLEAAYNGGRNGAAAGGTVNIQNMTVQSNNPAEFAGGLQRLDGTQSYNTVIR